MSKSSELDKTVKAYILSCVDNSGYSDKELNSNADKIAFIQESFESEAGWNIKRVGRQTAMRDWLQGLPSALTVAFYNVDILALAKQLGSIPADATEKQEDKILDHYWDFMAAKTCQLFDGYMVPHD